MLKLFLVSNVFIIIKLFLKQMEEIDNFEDTVRFRKILLI